MSRLKNLGISVIPIVEVKSIGLERIRASFFLGPRKINDTRHFFGSLNETAGLRYYSRSLISRRFDCEFNIPQGKNSELDSLFLELEKMKLVRECSFSSVIWKDFPRLKTDLFDYSAGLWDVDFSRLVGDPSSRALVARENDRSSIDYKDLMITKELEIDPSAKAVDISGKIGCPPRDVVYHLASHVLGKIIRSFRIRWIGTPDAWSKHSIVGLTLVFKKIDNQQTLHAESILTSLPFLWSHSRTLEGYLAEFLIPLSMLVETLNYVSVQLDRVDLTPEIYSPDWSCTSSFTIPYQLFDRESRTWSFDAERAVSTIFEKAKPKAEKPHRRISSPYQGGQ
jgi:hypothetical protein